MVTLRVKREPPKITPEQRAAALIKAREARIRKSAERAASTLRKDFRDAAHWEDLARARGIELPPWGTPPAPSPMRAWLRKVGASVDDYYAWSGETAFTDFAKANLTWPLRAWAGIVLEWLAP